MTKVLISESALKELVALADKSGNMAYEPLSNAFNEARSALENATKDANNLQPFTVIGVHPDNGQIVCHHVEAKDSLNAFAVVAAKEDDMDMVVSMSGHFGENDLTWPGDGVVCSDTIREQKDVFGAPPKTKKSRP